MTASVMCPCGRHPATLLARTVCHTCYEYNRRRNPVRKPTAEERFFKLVWPTEEPLACWLWFGTSGPGGYGIFHPGRRGRMAAHRWSYEFFICEIPTGLVIDHLCRVPSCVNPFHLEPVTIAENTLRGEAPMIRASRTDTCQRGHSLADAIVVKSGPQKGRRNCRHCKRDRWAKKAADPEFRAKRAAYEKARRIAREVAA